MKLVNRKFKLEEFEFRDQLTVCFSWMMVSLENNAESGITHIHELDIESPDHSFLWMFSTHESKQKQ